MDAYKGTAPCWMPSQMQQPFPRLKFPFQFPNCILHNLNGNSLIRANSSEHTQIEPRKVLMFMNQSGESEQKSFELHTNDKKLALCKPEAELQ